MKCDDLSPGHVGGVARGMAGTGSTEHGRFETLPRLGGELECGPATDKIWSVVVKRLRVRGKWGDIYVGNAGNATRSVSITVDGRCSR